MLDNAVTLTYVGMNNEQKESNMTTSARCYYCRKTRECHTYEVAGGANYKRSGRAYRRNVCRDCCVEAADITRYYRFARGIVYHEHLDGIKNACEAFAVAVDDLPNTASDTSQEFDAPTQPINWDISTVLTTEENREACAAKGWN